MQREVIMHAISEQTLEIFKTIPIYPMEITITEIKKKTGIRKPIIINAILGFQSDYPICESDKSALSYTSPMDKKRFLDKMNKGKIRSRK